MSKYTKKINELFISIGFFPEDYAQFLDSLEHDAKRNFIYELYDCIVSNKYKRIIESNKFGVGKANGKVEYRYSEEDMEQAKKTKAAYVERLLSGKSEEEVLKYRACKIFHERKFSEIQFAFHDIKEIYRRYAIELKNIETGYVSEDSIFKGRSLNFIEYPVNFTKQDLTLIFDEHEVRELFRSKHDFEIFKKNTFKLFSSRDTPQVLDIPFDRSNKKKLGHFLYNLYSRFVKHKKEYSNIRFDKTIYAEALMNNFSICRENRDKTKTFESILANNYKLIR